MAGEPARQQTSFQAAVALVDLKLPRAIEAEPVLAYKLRPRVLGAGSGHWKAPKEWWVKCMGQKGL